MAQGYDKPVEGISPLKPKNYLDTLPGFQLPQQFTPGNTYIPVNGKKAQNVPGTPKGKSIMTTYAQTAEQVRKRYADMHGAAQAGQVNGVVRGYNEPSSTQTA